jgi:hypothetical protein
MSSIDILKSSFSKDTNIGRTMKRELKQGGKHSFSSIFISKMHSLSEK